MAVNSFKLALHLAEATADDHDVVSIGEVGHMKVSSNLNPWVSCRAWSIIQSSM